MWRRRSIASLLALVLLALSAATCVHKAPLILGPIVRWTIPLGADDSARLCVMTALDGQIDPGDVLPMRCVSIGGLRAWIRAQRLAD